ncbi:MAG: MATE family efflux transporter [Cognatishimia sp.]
MIKTQMTYGGHTRALLTLGLPLIGGHVAQFAIGLTDTIMLGWYSVDALAAVVLGSTLFFVTFILGSGFGIAVMPMVAEAEAQGDELAIRRIARMGLWLSAFFAVALLPLFWFSGPVLEVLGQEAALAAEAQVYLRVMGIGLLPALLVMVLKSYLAALEHTRIVFWITVMAATVNALVNYILIFGHFGAPEMGILGAAIASLVVQVVSIVGVVIYARHALPEHALFARIWRPDGEILKDVFHVGMPIGLTNLAEVGLFAASTTMMGWLGKIPLAAHGIALNLAGLAFMLHLGLSNAATVRAGNALGRKDAEHLARGATTAIFVSLVMAVGAVLVFVSIPEVLIGAFVDSADPDFERIVTTGVALLMVAAMFQFVDGAQAMALGLLRGVMDTRKPMIIAVFSYWAVGMSCSYVFGFVLGWGGVGVWLGLVVGLCVAAVLLLNRFWRGKLLELKQSFAG